MSILNYVLSYIDNSNSNNTNTFNKIMPPVTIPPTSDNGDESEDDESDEIENPFDFIFSYGPNEKEDYLDRRDMIPRPELYEIEPEIGTSCIQDKRFSISQLIVGCKYSCQEMGDNGLTIFDLGKYSFIGNWHIFMNEYHGYFFTEAGFDKFVNEYIYEYISQ
jgi:hypothetical protein